MSRHKKNKQPGPIPPANRPHVGPQVPSKTKPEKPAEGARFNEHDPKRRLGEFTGAGEHAFVQPGGHNDANR
jgi:hypothetical protein